MVRKPTPKLDRLRARLLKQTKGRGSKSQLAANLGISRQHFYHLLSGNMEPGGEITLALLEWVTAAEAKTKRPARAETRTGLKTRQKRTTNEKPSGPKGKT
jgi:hypothetical protein